MAADVYSQPPYAGRGGWSWYTGAAAWMHRATIESIFGLKHTAQTLAFHPHLPSHWPQAEITLVRGARSMRFLLVRASHDAALPVAAQHSASLLAPGKPLFWQDHPPHSSFVIPF